MSDFFTRLAADVLATAVSPLPDLSSVQTISPPLFAPGLADPPADRTPEAPLLPASEPDSSAAVAMPTSFTATPPIAERPPLPDGLAPLVPASVPVDAPAPSPIALLIPASPPQPSAATAIPLPNLPTAAVAAQPDSGSMNQSVVAIQPVPPAEQIADSETAVSPTLSLSPPPAITAQPATVPTTDPPVMPAPQTARLETAVAHQPSTPPGTPPTLPKPTLPATTTTTQTDETAPTTNKPLLTSVHHLSTTNHPQLATIRPDLPPTSAPTEARAAEAAVAPTVTITIGRVIVQAAPPPTVAAPPSIVGRRQPAVSLQTYLERNGGKG
ncbi:MAG: hypothetical protein IPM39_19675 [Chloroflexi bacterium]|nr:hypothetical protein [Chloroflexota bacterium]